MSHRVVTRIEILWNKDTYNSDSCAKFSKISISTKYKNSQSGKPNDIITNVIVVTETHVWNSKWKITTCLRLLLDLLKINCGGGGIHSSLTHPFHPPLALPWRIKSNNAFSDIEKTSHGVIDLAIKWEIYKNLY